MDRPSAIYESEKQLKALADVLEGKEYKNTGATNGESKWLKYIAEQIEKNGVSGSSIQPDWNQNDESADDYIKNRPFYEYKASAGLLNGMFKFTSDNNLYIAKPTFEYDFIVGETYTVNFDGRTFKCNAIKINDYWYALGNLSFINMGENTNEPFVIEKQSSGYSIKTNISKSNISVEVTGNAMIATKIPEKYLPDNIGSGSSVQPDWNQTNIYDKSYIKNKPNVIGAKGTGLYSEIFNYPSNHMNKNTASGEASHAEGNGTKASGNYSHAEGMETKAEGYQSHSEGFKTTAKGDHSHAEGSLTSATKTGAHAEGMYTLASSSYQHTQGKYNVEDANNIYAHIVGNGASETKRSNAHTLDWSGNAWYAGTVEGTAMIVKSSTEGSSKRFKITVDDSGVITATEITA